MSWINWYYGLQPDVILRRMYEEDQILNETWRRQHTTKEQAEYIPPDYDETLDNDPVILFTEWEQNSFQLLEQKIEQPKQNKKLRVPIPKRVKIALVRERGGMCEVCKDNLYHHIHHVDGNPSNNHPSNLLLVCFECHKEIEKK